MPRTLSRPDVAFLSSVVCFASRKRVETFSGTLLKGHDLAAFLSRSRGITVVAGRKSALWIWAPIFGESLTRTFCHVAAVVTMRGQLVRLGPISCRGHTSRVCVSRKASENSEVWSTLSGWRGEKRRERPPSTMYFPKPTAISATPTSSGFLVVERVVVERAAHAGE